jgi:hypothetical protein
MSLAIPPEELIASLAIANEVDVLVLAECKSDPNDLIRNLNRDAAEYQYAPGLCEEFWHGFAGMK